MLTERSRPTFHVGSFLAEKIEKELSNAALEMFVMSLTADGRLWPEICQRKDFTRALFTFVNWPLTDTSKQNTSTLKPTERSLTSGAYFRTFRSWLVSTLESQGTVSSNNTTFRDCRFTKTKSGRWFVTRISGGIVPPLPALRFSKSTYNSKPGFRLGEIKS